jgi:hypothetical protein
MAVGCGSNPATHDMGMADMSIGPDMAMRVPNGVACGTNLTCAVGQDCCVSFANNQATGATCVTSTSQCSGAVLACDGPEDCTTPNDACCATVNLSGIGADAGAMITGGNSKCGQCSATVSLTGSIMTRLCHVTDDCKSFSASVPIIGKIDFNKCCTGANSGGIQFCAPDPATLGAFAGGGAGYTCQ